MGVTIMSGGLPVNVDGAIYSWSAAFHTYGKGVFGVVDQGVGSLRDPDHVWRTQRSVRTVVGFLAKNIAQVPLHGFRVQPDGDRERIADESVLARALKSPHPQSTPYEFMRRMVKDRCLWDRFAALKVSDGDTVRLVRLPPRSWVFERDSTGLPVSVVWSRQDGELVRYGLDAVLWTDAAEKDSTPMDALFDLLTEQDESGKYRTELWQNGARMPGWISRPADAPAWSVQARDNFKAGWSKFAGGGARAGHTPLLEDDMAYHELQNGVTPEAAQQIESRKLSIAEVAAHFHVPPVFVGLLDNANYSNVSAYREQLYSDVLGPDFMEIQQAYNARLVPDIAGLGEFVEFNVAEKLRMSFEQQAEIFQKSTGAPIMTRNEARRRINLPRLDGADDLVVPLNVAATADGSIPTQLATSGGI